MVIFGLLSDHNIRPASTVFEFDIFFVRHSVEVFMEAVHQEGQQLLRVLLLEAGEGGVVVTNGPPHLDWGQRPDLGGPHLLDEVAEPLGHLALVAQRVLSVQLPVVTVIVEVGGQDLGVGHALDGSVHVTGVAQIVQTRHTCSCIQTLN